MKKIAPVILTILLLTLFSCGDAEIKELNYDVLLNEIEGAADIASMYALSADDIKIEYGIKSEQVSKINVYMSMNAGSCDEIFICEAVDAEAKEDIINRLNTHKTNRMEEMSDYENLPDVQKQYLNIERAQIIEYGNLIFFVILDDETPVVNIINEAIA